jgi:predicted O-methyltransferase YrrM
LPGYAGRRPSSGNCGTAVITEVPAMGFVVGPASFNGFYDGDARHVRAIEYLIRHLKPANVFATGVAHGFTSRFILEALERNGSGRLSSIELLPLDPALQNQIGIAVGDRVVERWTLIPGLSRRCLPGLLSRLGKIDLFIHDSRHAERNLRFELDRAWPTLHPGGALLVDDIDSNWGFQSFTQAFSGYNSLVCEADIRAERGRP